MSLSRKEVQVLRRINLSPGQSYRRMGLFKKEFRKVVLLGLVEWRECEFLHITRDGIEFLKSINARTFGNTEWDDEVFKELLMREPAW